MEFKPYLQQYSAKFNKEMDTLMCCSQICYKFRFFPSSHDTIRCCIVIYPTKNTYADTIESFCDRFTPSDDFWEMRDYTFCFLELFTDGFCFKIKLVPTYHAFNGYWYLWFVVLRYFYRITIDVHVGGQCDCCTRGVVSDFGVEQINQSRFLTTVLHLIFVQL